MILCAAFNFRSLQRQLTWPLSSLEFASTRLRHYTSAKRMFSGLYWNQPGCPCIRLCTKYYFLLKYNLLETSLYNWNKNGISSIARNRQVVFIHNIHFALHMIYLNFFIPGFVQTDHANFYQ